MTPLTDIILFSAFFLFCGCVLTAGIYWLLQHSQKPQPNEEALLKRLTELHDKLHNVPDEQQQEPLQQEPIDCPSDDCSLLYFFMMKNYPRFMEELSTHTAARLTPAEEHTCFLIKLKLPNKVIAGCMNVTTTTVSKNKQRLRHKLPAIPPDVKLVDWIQLLGERHGPLPPEHMTLTEKKKNSQDYSSN